MFSEVALVSFLAIYGKYVAYLLSNPLTKLMPRKQFSSGFDKSYVVLEPTQ